MACWKQPQECTVICRVSPARVSMRLKGLRSRCFQRATKHSEGSRLATEHRQNSSVQPSSIGVHSPRVRTAQLVQQSGESQAGRHCERMANTYRTRFFQLGKADPLSLL